MRGSVRQAGQKTGSCHQTAEEVRRLKDVRSHREPVRHNTKAPLCTEYVSSCVLCAIICYNLDNCNCEPCLMCLLICFRRINHMAVKNPFAFILWCTWSCVGHSKDGLKWRNKSTKYYRPRNTTAYKGDRNSWRYSLQLSALQRRRQEVAFPPVIPDYNHCPLWNLTVSNMAFFFGEILVIRGLPQTVRFALGIEVGSPRGWEREDNIHQTKPLDTL